MTTSVANITYKVGDKDTRPWGTWEVVNVGPGYIVKKITVTQGQLLSLQRHQHRAEHWVIVSGTATVTIDDKEFEAKADEAVHIPQQAKHRMGNNYAEELCFIEIQIGEILDENDIERFDDRYGRAN